MVNRLAAETSPYLLQHADNPVDWFAWGDDAFDAARRRDVPIFLSVGYSSCHWCHVMAHESFEDDATADYLNEHFVSIKVDREERPDVDAVYMEATQALSGHGGWPMSVFLDHHGRPFHAGTYWPDQPRQGMPSFRVVLEAVTEAWQNDREQLSESAQTIASTLAGRSVATPGEDMEVLAVTDAAAALLMDRAWDRRHGGFGRAPKFPQAMTIEYLLDRHVRTGEPGPLEAAVHSLDAMARGGIHDQLAGGFHRYSVDAQWLVPHFEKMLYDNALLLASYAKAAAVTGRDDLTRAAHATATYLLHDLRHPDGGFWSATDADSEGVEGKYFTWSFDELTAAIASADRDGELWADFFGAAPAGNWEGTNILHEPIPRDQFVLKHGLDRSAFDAELDTVVDGLLSLRAKRVPPGLDDKVLASWNALAIRGLTRAGRLLAEPRYIREAIRTAHLIESELVVDGVLHHTWKDGEARVPAFLEDVAFLAGAYLDLYQATGDVRWYRRTVELADDAVLRFRDPAGGYFQTAADADALYLRPKETWDNATPSGNSVLAEVFAKLSLLTGDAGWHDRAMEILRLFQDGMRTQPPGYGYCLQVVEFLAGEPLEVAIVGPAGPERDQLVALVDTRGRADIVLAVAEEASPAMDDVPLLAGRTGVAGGPAAYVCRGFVCEAPVTTPAELSALLAR